MHLLVIITIITTTTIIIILQLHHLITNLTALLLNSLNFQLSTTNNQQSTVKMAAPSTLTWLQHLETQLDVDVDWMDPEYITSMAPFSFHDQTSNQGWVDHMIHHPSNAQLVKDVCAELKDAGVLAIYTRIAARLCKANVPLISGRVLLQTLPSFCYDFDKTLAHARLYDAEFARVGIDRSRYVIKIPSVGPALNAAKILQAEGIQTLGTALFGVPQAIAASQASMLYISPYYNEVIAHDDRSLWPQSADPALHHTMSPRLVHILETYRRLYRETGKEQPRLKNASFISAEEAMAAGEQGCHSATISYQVLNELASRTYDPAKQPHGGAADRPKPAHPYKDAPPLSARLAPLMKIDPLAAKPAEFTGQLASADVDYLADNGKALQEAIEADLTAKKRFADAMALFTAAEDRSKAKIEEVLATL
jgi:transaldolase